MLELHAVSKRYGELLAVDACSLALSPGATTVLIGPSGCGKSTLLRLMIGLQRPDAGEVSFDGRALALEDDAALAAARHRMGYVIQDGGLFPHLTARDNVALLARHLGWDARRVQARLVELSELTHLPPAALERFPAQLSGGQRQRVGLMRALMLDPEVLLLDEPLGALDPMIRHELQGELREIFIQLKKTVALVTHDLAEAAFLGDTIVLLRAGRIVQRGTLETMLAAPAEPFVELFVQAQRPRSLGTRDVEGSA